MECRQAYFYLNIRGRGAGDLGPESTAELDRHLAACPDCAAVARRFATEDRTIARAMNAVPVPAGLKAKLHRGLNDRLAATRRRRSYRLAAMAACLAIGVSLVFGYRAMNRPRFDPDSLVFKADRTLDNPEEDTRLWLEGQKLPSRLPLAFDSTMLVFRGGESLQGQDVPVLVFYNRHTGQRAKVLILKDEQFANLKATPDAMSSYFRTTTLRDDANGLSYVILHTSEDLKPFLKSANLNAA